MELILLFAFVGIVSLAGIVYELFFDKAVSQF